MSSRKPPKTTTSSQNVSTVERRPNSLKRVSRAPICVLFPAPSIPEKLTILHPRSLSIFSSPGGHRNFSEHLVAEKQRHRSPWMFLRLLFQPVFEGRIETVERSAKEVALAQTGTTVTRGSAAGR